MDRNDVLSEYTYNRVKLTRKRLPYRGSLPAYKLSLSLKEIKKDLDNLFTAFNGISSSNISIFEALLEEVETILARLNSISIRIDTIVRSIDYV